MGRASAAPPFARFYFETGHCCRNSPRWPAAEYAGGSLVRLVDDSQSTAACRSARQKGSRSRDGTTSLQVAVTIYVSVMNWAAEDLALLKKLWVSGRSAAQIAGRLGCSRNAVSGKLTRLGLKRGRRPPTAKPKIISVPKRSRASLATCSRSVAKVVSSRKHPQGLSKRQLYAMLAEAVRNTG